MNVYNYTPRLQSTLAAAEKIAKDCGHSYIGTEHVFIAILRGKGLVPETVNSSGVGAEDLAKAVESKICPQPKKPVDDSEQFSKVTIDLFRKLADALEKLDLPKSS